MFAEILFSKYGRTHYLVKYVNFINRCIEIERNGYTEKHHILPKCEFDRFKDELWNVISVTPREHLIAHFILSKALGGMHWVSVNFMLQCENPYQKRKRFPKVEF
jgi:hypothetical protein